jgi:hypothetical protein
MADFEHLTAIKAEMKTEIKTNQERLEARGPITRSLGSFELLSSPGWISTEPRQKPDQPDSYQLKPTDRV